MNSIILIRKIFYYIPVKILPALATLFFISFLYRQLPEGEYTRYSIGVAISIVTAQILGNWINNSYIFFKNTDELGLNIKSQFKKLSLISSILGLSLVTTVSYTYFTNFSSALTLGILCCIQVNFYFLSALHQSSYEVAPQLWATVAQSSTQVLLVLLLFFYYGATVELAFLTLVVSFLLGSLILLIASSKKETQLDNIPIKKILGYGLPLSLWTAFTLLVTFGDRYLVAIIGILGSDQYLSVKDLLLGASGLLSMPLLMVLHPYILEKSRKTGFTYTLVFSAIKFLFVIFLILYIFWTTIGSLFYFQLTQKEKLLSTSIELLIVSSLAINCINIYAQKILEVEEKTLILLRLSLYSLILFFFFGLLLGYLFGVWGLAFSGNLANLFYLYLIMKNYPAYKINPALLAKLIGLIAYAWLLVYAWSYIPTTNELVSPSLYLWLIGFIASSALLIIINLKPLLRELK